MQGGGKETTARSFPLVDVGNPTISYTVASEGRTQERWEIPCVQSKFVDELLEIQIPSHRRTEKVVPCHNKSSQS